MPMNPSRVTPFVPAAGRRSAKSWSRSISLEMPM